MPSNSFVSSSDDARLPLVRELDDGSVQNTSSHPNPTEISNRSSKRRVGVCSDRPGFTSGQHIASLALSGDALG
ncbi:hypothetical protein GGTG_07837 [Gaeumannomyces tritici R3-111a-1]|uniref:Uncharacterized protein n=1 Tax=Gaeumannomyces tritici (strain R3-111a-1) TaxID=644352 RepID=J3P2U5_GAET3|nr:hypothetical protein GGTG_07837 [Gaeumannomyces tritici R3-111a-1]EJT73987.1 hypothetical protein GGTG_07837 [Gaeumannomyces tritici R3-111a-1]